MKLKVTLLIHIIYSISFPQVDSVVTYYPDGKPESITYFNKSLREGKFISYYENGNIKEERDYQNDKVTGTIKIYYPNGNLKEIFNIEDGKREGVTSYYDSNGVHIEDVLFEKGLRKGQDFQLIGEYRYEDYLKLLEEWKRRQEELKKENGDLIPPSTLEESNFEDDPAYFINVEILPEPIGGWNSLYDKISYPKEARQKKVEGTVKILAFIERNGEVSSASIVEGIGYGCDENVRLAVYYTRFKPGILKGKPVKVQMIIPIEFSLSKFK
jgi:TonB family protein